MSPRMALLRQRSAETIERVNATLAEPRDPEMVARAQAYCDDLARRRSEEAAAASPPVVPTRTGTGLTRSAIALLAQEIGPVVRDAMDRRFDATEAAVGRLVAQERQAAQWRITELERRLAEVEGRAHG